MRWLLCVCALPLAAEEPPKTANVANLPPPASAVARAVRYKASSPAQPNLTYTHHPRRTQARMIRRNRCTLLRLTETRRGGTGHDTTYLLSINRGWAISANLAGSVACEPPAILHRGRGAHAFSPTGR